jgi:hypothetical protein
MSYPTPDLCKTASDFPLCLMFCSTDVTAKQGTEKGRTEGRRRKTCKRRLRHRDPLVRKTYSMDPRPFLGADQLVVSCTLNTMSSKFSNHSTKPCLLWCTDRRTDPQSGLEHAGLSGALHRGAKASELPGRLHQRCGQDQCRSRAPGALPRDQVSSGSRRLKAGKMHLSGML